MEGLNEIVSSRSKEKAASMEFPHRRFLFETKDTSFSAVFKSQEELVPVSDLEKKSVVFIGDTPYARDEEKVRQYYDSLDAHTDFHTLQNSKERFGRKYHFSAPERVSEYEWKYHRADTLVTQNPLKPETDLSFLALEKLREAGKDGKVEFVINSDAETLVHAAKLIAKTYPDIKKGEPLIEETPSAIEDYIIAASFDEKGDLVDSMDETRYKVLRALLGYEEDAIFLKKKLEENRERFAPLKIVKLINSRLNIVARLEKNLAELQRLEEATVLEKENTLYLEGQIATFKERIKEDQNGLESVDRLVAEYTNNKFEISESVVQELDKYVLIHMTDFYPVFDEDKKEWVIPTHTKATGDKAGRLSIHFSIDGIATATAMPTGNGDNWTTKPYAIVAPLGQMIKKNGLMDNMMPADTWWVVDPDKKGIRLPDSATIIALSPHGKGDIQESLGHRPGKGIHKETLNLDGQAVANFIKEKYGAELESLGNDTWHSDSKRWKSETLFKNLRKLNPFILEGRHSGMQEETFERSMIGFLNRGLVADKSVKPDFKPAENREGVIKTMNKESEYETKIIPREFARQMIKSGIL